MQRELSEGRRTKVELKNMPDKTIAKEYGDGSIMRLGDDNAKLKIDVSPVGGDDVLRAIERIAHAPPDLLQYMKALLAANKGG